MTSAMSTTLPDLSLKNGVAAIDGGTSLTLATSAQTNSTTLVVADARYFQDGNFGLGSVAWPSSVSIQPDWIAIGTVSNVVQISSINYSTNTITLASPKTWANNAPIWLYKKSDGVQVLYGTAPDYGAYEYAESTPPPDTTPPAAPTGVQIAAATFVRNLAAVVITSFKLFWDTIKNFFPTW
jgi:hypothetical protein